ncbi:MAG: hypothetical protein UY44_C0012G0007 [Candidatus Kaiserbacteria bacterium GW2011_GWA2_49_19]|uniref:Uncharacterized protein n=2 Tax=Parcubacteria group TaxID=1794811 RepID=A0A1G2FZL5_9BACT|nr:MAG: hypothetical protein UY44_C0012G0007 [Candidatus Kaiserbacteria bacterium GW2011_GWA2_49_19]OGZ43287.1 MAG: hypothetical protein A2756_04165 [Candidatus Ryanbacteria bacterium RIFCSPHIGHO2_01_FULL_48_27]
MNAAHSSEHTGTFTVLGESFEIKHFPRLYNMYCTSPDNLERQLQGIADAWHEGSIRSAAVAFESDLQHG